MKKITEPKNNTEVRRRPPSYYRYKAKHPTISFALVRELKELLDTVKGSRSYGKATRDILVGNLTQLNALAVEHARRSGLREAETKFKITYPCANCGKEVTLLPNAKDHQAVRKFLKEEGWCHGGNCPE